MLMGTAAADMITVIAVMILAIGLLRWIDNRWGGKLSETDLEEKVRVLEQRIDFLIGELQKAGVRINELELELRQMGREKTIGGKKNAATVEKPLLFICGADDVLCDADHRQLRRAGVPFTRLFKAEQSAIEKELQRHRSDNRPYRWVHVTAHAGPEGIMLADGLADAKFWNEELFGVEVVFLAACQTADVADAIAGLVTVVYVLEDIENEDAAHLTYAFWRSMMFHGDARRAFNDAMTTVPNVAEFSDIREA